MSSQIIPVEPFDYVVFRGHRRSCRAQAAAGTLPPSDEGQFTEPTRSSAPRARAFPMTNTASSRSDALKEHLKAGEFNEAEVEKFTSRLYYVSVDAKSEQGWDDLKKLLEEGKTVPVPSISPSDRRSSATFPKRSAITSSSPEHPHRRREADRPRSRPRRSSTTRSAKSSRRADFPHRPLSRQGDGAESDGPALCQRLYKPLWNSAHIDHVQITVSEAVGLENPARLLRQGGRAARHGAEPHPPAPLFRRHGGADVDGRGAVRDEKLKCFAR